MKLFSVKGLYDDGYSYRGDKEVWTIAEDEREASKKVEKFYNAQYDTFLSPKKSQKLIVRPSSLTPLHIDSKVKRSSLDLFFFDFFSKF